MGLTNYAFVLFIFLLSFYGSNAQTKTIERLKENIEAQKTVEEKLKAIFDLCNLGYSLHPDTLMAYGHYAKSIATQKKDVHSEVKAMYYASFALTNKGLIDSSLNVANRCLEILSGKIDDPVLYANLLNQKGRCFMRKNKYKEAIDMGYRVIDVSEKSGDALLQVKGKTLIGWAYLEIGQTKEALLWHLKALYTTTDTLLLQKYAILYANLALNYNGLGKTDSAFYFIDKAIHYSRKHENLFALSNSLAIQSQLFVRSGRPRLAESPLKEVVDIRKLIGDPFYIVSDMAQLGLYYAHYNQPEKGIAICNEGIIIANKYKIETKLFFLYSTLAENYKALGNTAKHAEILEKIILLKDSVYGSNSVEALAEMQAKYDVQKKENTIIRQKFSLMEKNYLLYGSLLLLLLGTVTSYLFFKDYRRRQRRMNLQAVAAAEEAERKRIAADLHDNLGAFAASISSNLGNITINESDKMNAAALQELKSNSQSIVSQLNDTIWVLKKEEQSLTAISDRLKVFIQKIQSGYPEVTIDVIEAINPDRMLSPSQAFHLFQMVKEALTNALKHSSCQQLTVFIESNVQWKITITDDGKGMTQQKTLSEGGNGLSNMKTRAKEAGWLLIWEPKNPQGTSVIIQPTTTN